MKRFNVTGTCYPEDHYMVDISERLRIIAQMVERGDYFCINAGRQYGKTTTLYQLKKKLDADYCIFSISFEGLADSAFESLDNLGTEFIWMLSRCIKFRETQNASDDLKNLLKDLSQQKSLLKLSPQQQRRLLFSTEQRNPVHSANLSSLMLLLLLLQQAEQVLR